MSGQRDTLADGVLSTQFQILKDVPKASSDKSRSSLQEGTAAVWLVLVGQQFFQHLQIPFRTSLNADNRYGF